MENCHAYTLFPAKECPAYRSSPVIIMVSSVGGMARDIQAKGRRFESQPRRFFNCTLFAAVCIVGTWGGNFGKRVNLGMIPRKVTKTKTKQTLSLS
jgi:hypothetical protein